MIPCLLKRAEGSQGTNGNELVVLVGEEGDGVGEDLMFHRERRRLYGPEQSRGISRDRAARDSDWANVRIHKCRDWPMGVGREAVYRTTE